ncbi:MAG: diadenylate cyclase [Thermoplasmatota archaeon]
MSQGNKTKKARETSYHNGLQMLSMSGNVDKIISNVTSARSKKKEVIMRIIDILIGLSLKGYEGKSVGALFLIGDIEGIRRHTSQMIINPFKGWRNISILDDKQRLTFESFSQLDGAFVIDSRGLAHYAGRMIHVVPDRVRDDRGFHDRRQDRKGAGTRWRAAMFITERTKTVAVTLSNRGDITLFERGKEIGRLERRIIKIDDSKLGELIIKD